MKYGLIGMMAYALIGAVYPSAPNRCDKPSKLICRKADDEKRISAAHAKRARKNAKRAAQRLET